MSTKALGFLKEIKKITLRLEQNSSLPILMNGGLS